MAEQYYVRIRGRVQGPFDAEKIRTLASRGNISRMHEISTDGSTWGNGSNYPELFQSPAAATQSVSHSTISTNSSSGSTETQTPAEPNQTAPSGSPRIWFYAQGNNEIGPVDVETLRGLLHSKQVSSDTLVWREGMPQWSQANQVPGLIQQGGAVSIQGQESFSFDNSQQSSESNEISPTVSRALNGSRGWVFFLAIVGYIFAVITLIGGLILIIAGARSQLFPVVAQGLFSLIQAVICAVGAFMLNSIASRISRVESQRTERSLINALDSMRTFWAFIGILVIVWLAFVLIIAIWLISIGFTLSQMMENDDQWTAISSILWLV